MSAADLESLGFDRYQRFKATAALIEGLAQGLAPGRALEVLDVGGFDNALAAFLPGHRVRPWEGKVLSTTTGLPLETGSQDVWRPWTCWSTYPPLSAAFSSASWPG